jgi:hypoxanthine phosphoribosyltransferase
MNKIYINYNQLQGHVLDILRQMQKDEWKPDYVVGITRGGLLPAALISQYLDIPMHTLKIALRDDSADNCESNCWMSEDASEGKKILIVDDINDTGATIAWLHEDWQSNCLGEWDKVWHNNVKFAVIVNNIPSKEFVDYSSFDIDKNKDPSWVVFPTENFWNKN